MPQLLKPDYFSPAANASLSYFYQTENPVIKGLMATIMVSINSKEKQNKASAIMSLQRCLREWAHPSSR